MKLNKEFRMIDLMKILKGNNFFEWEYKELGKKPSICLSYSNELKLDGVYMGRPCPRCGAEKECGCGVERSPVFSTPEAKNKLGWNRANTTNLTKIWAWSGKIEFFPNITFRVIKTQKRFFLFINKDGYLELKYIVSKKKAVEHQNEDVLN